MAQKTITLTIAVAVVNVIVLGGIIGMIQKNKGRKIALALLMCALIIF